MLPYFAASGHNNYCKSAMVYLAQMEALESTHPYVYQKFIEGHCVIRWKDRYWGGVADDMVIEQDLMASIKSHSGMTHRKGVNERQRALFCGSVKICAAVNNAMQTVTNVHYTTSDQHKEAGAL